MASLCTVYNFVKHLLEQCKMQSTTHSLTEVKSGYVASVHDSEYRSILIICKTDWRYIWDDYCAHSTRGMCVDGTDTAVVNCAVLISSVYLLMVSSPQTCFYAMVSIHNRSRKAVYTCMPRGFCTVTKTTENQVPLRRRCLDIQHSTTHH